LGRHIPDDAVRCDPEYEELEARFLQAEKLQDESKHWKAQNQSRRDAEMSTWMLNQHA
jgi:hypothetical protein